MDFALLRAATTPEQFEALREEVRSLYDIGFQNRRERDMQLALIDEAQQGNLVWE